jgi:hypothetical protein
MKIRHKTNWERVVDALKSLEKSYDLTALETLKRELLPKYETIKAKREKCRAQVYASRRKRGRKKVNPEYTKAYAKAYYEAHREQLRKYNREYQRKRRHKD